jgi:glycosyltransferase involved in cell wall biosynthesis
MRPLHEALSQEGQSVHTPVGPISVAHFLVGRCNPESANGVDKTIYHLSRTQAGLGHRVAVFSITDKAAIPIPGVEVRTYQPVRPPLPLPNERLKDLLFIRSPLNLPRDLVTDLLAWRPSIVHLHFVHVPQNIRLGRRLQLAGIPYCVSLNGGLALEAQRRRWAAKKVYAALYERSYLHRAAFLHAISHRDVEGALAYGAENRFVVAPNCIDPGEMPEVVDPGLLRQRFPTLDGRRVFLYLGRLDPDQKGLDLLLHAWAELRHAGRDDAALVLVGPNWRGGQDRLEALAHTLGIGGSVSFAGPASGTDKWSLLTAADVFVHPSRWEAGIPFAVLEALLAGRPVLLTRAADPNGLVERYGAGFVLEPRPDSIGKGLLEAARLDSAGLQQLGSAARRLVDREFRWEKTSKELLDEYRTVAVR